MRDSDAEASAWARVDTTVPHSARVWDFLLGGKDHFPVDREAGETLLRLFPDFAMVARLQREFLIRSVRYLVQEAGIRQFLDIGTGLPTANNTHEVAQGIAPETRVVYVDHDPIVLAHARALLTSAPEGATDYVDADVRRPDIILEEAAKTLDLSRPTAVMMLSIAGQVTDDDDPRGIVERLMRPLASGSYLALSDGTNTNPALIEAVTAYNRNAANTYQLRSPEQIAGFFTGLEVVEPGVVPTPEWRPDPDRWDEPAGVISAVCGVARKP
ncbi:SAM-dependent methyltransferase [Nonomuraea aridisoli]|uniref:S-adenosyl methyltransferase n=1 Tax=Nonomuraea aridisoli TaxID=2070368 RepID=A0A2W2FFN5_9ACTN|nr:SAM-dependent methyltransferase [Nonomuraea aridisoli]PZG23488.1 S-adenosyl methyltransferase [Nonomuraea aridisoli]